MLRGILQRSITQLRQTELALQKQHLASLAKIVPAKEKWDLYAGVLVERPPVISKSLTPLEQQFQELLWRVEYEKSLKSITELQHERELLQAELIRNGEMEVDLDDASSTQTVQDLRDAYTEELKRFHAASRITTDDEKNNTMSTNRCLENNLYLLVEHRLGDQTHLLLPQGICYEDETLRQTAERVLVEHCGEKLLVDFYGNAPCGFYKYKFPATMRDHSVGAKVFFYHATLRQGNVDRTVKEKYEWLEKSKLLQKLKNNGYADAIQKFI